MKRSVAAVGDVADPTCWSGIPFHFWKTSRKSGFAKEAWSVDLRKVSWQRAAWNFSRMLNGGVGGFQYSDWFLDLIEKQIPPELWETEVITFNQHFPRSGRVIRAGGSLNHYLDAPFVALASGRGLDLRLPGKVVERAAVLERENFAASQRVMVMARWAAEVVTRECEVPATKVHVVLPGANLDLPACYDFAAPVGRAGKERDFILGYVGKDWRRKGLQTLLKVRAELARLGWRVKVLGAGNAPEKLLGQPGLQFVGFLDKQHAPEGFLNFLRQCDVGCLFSEREALGISTLEFLRAGIPVAGFAHEGLADTLPPDAGFRFERDASVEFIAEVFDRYLRDEDRQWQFREKARLWSGLVTWERCVREMDELWTSGAISLPVQPWRGLTGQLKAGELT